MTDKSIHYLKSYIFKTLFVSFFSSSLSFPSSFGWLGDGNDPVGHEPRRIENHGASLSYTGTYANSLDLFRQKTRGAVTQGNIRCFWKLVGAFFWGRSVFEATLGTFGTYASLLVLRALNKFVGPNEHEDGKDGVGNQGDRLKNGQRWRHCTSTAEGKLPHKTYITNKKWFFL